MSIQLTAGASLKTPMSYEGYLALGETKHHEYYDGLTVVNPPSRRHVRVANRLNLLLSAALTRGYEVLPEWGWQPSEETVFEPDLMVAELDAPGTDLLRTAPLLVVEVTSRSTRGEDLGRKMQAYALGGAEWYWIVDPEADSLTIYRNRGFRFVVELAGDASQPIVLTEPFATTIDLASVFAD